MEKYKNLVIACPKCLEPIGANFIECDKCSLVLTNQERDYLSEAAEGIYYWSWEYGVPFYNEYKKAGRIQSRYHQTAFEILSYLASVIAAGVIGNLAYDLIKGIALRSIKELRAKSEIKFVITQDKNDEQVFDILYKLADAYVEYKKTPFALEGEFSKVFSTIELSEPGKFLSPNLILELERIYFEYGKTVSEYKKRDIKDELDYLKYVWVMANPILRSDEQDQIIQNLAEGKYELVSSYLNEITDGRNYDQIAEEAVQRLNGISQDRITRSINVILELIENSVLALQRTPNAKLYITVSENKCTIEDNGPGMSPITVFECLLIPGGRGWIKTGILTEKETVDRIGVGFTASLWWCDRVIVQTKAKDTLPVAIELVINNDYDMKLFGHPDNATKLDTGTKIFVEIKPLRISSYYTGPASKIYLTDNVELKLLMLIKSYCGLVDNRIAIFLNGERINDEKKRGIGPKIFSFSLDKSRFTEKLEAPIYVAPIPENIEETNYKRSDYDNKFECIVEFYQNSLFLYFGSLSRIVATFDNLKNKGISEYQMSRLNNSIIRVFLPGHLPLLNSKLGLPWNSEEFIVEQILDLVHS